MQMHISGWGAPSSIGNSGERPGELARQNFGLPEWGRRNCAHGCASVVLPPVFA